MSEVKVKKESGQWETISGIVGPAGPQGPMGPSPVVVSPTPPANPAVGTIWIAA